MSDFTNIPAPQSAGPPPSIVIADDHTIIRNGLHLALSMELGIEPVAEASSCVEVMRVLRQHRPSHLILDMVFRDGNALEMLPAIATMLPDMHILVYTMMPKDVYFPAVRAHGVQHFLSKEACQEEISEVLCAFVLDTPTVQEASNEVRKYYTPSQEEASEDDDDDDKENPFSRLTTRELEVLHYLLRGDQVGHISQAMNLHKNTVSTVKARLMLKLRAQNMLEVFELAIIHRMSF